MTSDCGTLQLLKPPEMFAKTQIGSPYYVSPEMWKNKPYNSKTDMWAIGCFLYELVALHPPFQATFPPSPSPPWLPKPCRCGLTLPPPARVR